MTETGRTVYGGVGGGGGGPALPGVSRVKLRNFSLSGIDGGETIEFAYSEGGGDEIVGTDLSWDAGAPTDVLVATAGVYYVGWHIRDVGTSDSAAFTAVTYGLGSDAASHSLTATVLDAVWSDAGHRRSGCVVLPLAVNDVIQLTYSTDPGTTLLARDAELSIFRLA